MTVALELNVREAVVVYVAVTSLSVARLLDGRAPDPVMRAVLEKLEAEIGDVLGAAAELDDGDVELDAELPP